MANRANFAGNITNMTQTLSHSSTAFQEQKRQSEYKSADRRLINKIAEDRNKGKKDAQKYKEGIETDKRYSDLKNTELSNKRDEGRRSVTNLKKEEALGAKEKNSEEYKINEATAQQKAQGDAGEYGKAHGRINKYNTEEVLAEQAAQGDAKKYGTIRGGISKYNAKETYAEQRAKGSAEEYGTERGEIGKYNTKETLAEQKEQGNAEEYGTLRGGINKYSTEETSAQQTAQGGAIIYGTEKGQEGKEQQEFEKGRRLAKDKNASSIAGRVQGQKEKHDTEIQGYKNAIISSKNLYDIVKAEEEEEEAKKAYQKGYREHQIKPELAGTIQAKADFNNKIYQDYMNRNDIDPKLKASIDSTSNRLNYKRKQGEQQVSNSSVEYASGMYNKTGSYASNIEDLATFMDDIGSPQGPMIADYMRLYGKYFDAFKDIQNEKNKKDDSE